MSIDPSFMFLIHLFAYKMLGDIFLLFSIYHTSPYKLCGKKAAISCMWEVEFNNILTFMACKSIKYFASDLPEYELQNSHINLCHPHIWIFTQKSNS